MSLGPKPGAVAPEQQTSIGGSSSQQGALDLSLYYTKTQVDHLLGYRALVTDLTEFQNKVYTKTEIDNKISQSGIEYDLSNYVHIKKGAYNVNYDGGTFLDMNADFKGWYNLGYGKNPRNRNWHK